VEQKKRVKGKVRRKAKERVKRRVKGKAKRRVKREVNIKEVVEILPIIIQDVVLKNNYLIYYR